MVDLNSRQTASGLARELNERNGAPSPANLEAVLEDLRIRADGIRAELREAGGFNQLPTSNGSSRGSRRT